MSQDLRTLARPQDSVALAEYSRDPLGFMTRCAREFGEIVPLQFEGELFCLLTNPAHITEVLKDRLRFIKDHDTQRLRRLLGNGLITSEGDFWQRQRRLSQPMFHQQRISSYGAVMVDYTQQMLQTWQIDQILDIQALLGSWSKSYIKIQNPCTPKAETLGTLEISSAYHPIPRRANRFKELLHIFFDNLFY